MIGEEDGDTARLGLDARNSSGLVLDTGAGFAVTWLTVVVLGVRGPAGLEIDGVLALAELVGDLELCLDELPGIGGLGVRVEERVQVDARHVDDVAEHARVRLPDVERLGRRHEPLVAAGFEGCLAGSDERCEF